MSTKSFRKQSKNWRSKRQKSNLSKRWSKNSLKVWKHTKMNKRKNVKSFRVKLKAKKIKSNKKKTILRRSRKNSKKSKTNTLKSLKICRTNVMKNPKRKLSLRKNSNWSGKNLKILSVISRKKFKTSNKRLQMPRDRLKTTKTRPKCLQRSFKNWKINLRRKSEVIPLVIIKKYIYKFC